MSVGTLTPSPWLTFEDANGIPYAGAKLFTYASGTSTKLAVYTDAALTVAHPNPIILDSAGRVVIYLPQAAFKYVLAPSSDSDPPIAPLKTVDPVGAVPVTTLNLDIPGTAGEALVTGNVVYLSDGAGGRVAGQWYKTDADLAYASSAAKLVGMMPADLASGVLGAVRIVGTVTGLSALTAGTNYYASTTAGALVGSAPGPPSTNIRLVGVADSTTSLILGEKAKAATRERRIALHTTFGNTGAGEQIALDYFATAGELSADDMSYRGLFWGKTANNVNAKLLKVRLIEGANNAQIIQTTLTPSEAGDWRASFEILRSGATTARADGLVVVGPTNGPASKTTTKSTSPTATWANAIEIQVTVEGTANNDTTCEGGYISMIE